MNYFSTEELTKQSFVSSLDETDTNAVSTSTGERQNTRRTTCIVYKIRL